MEQGYDRGMRDMFRDSKSSFHSMAPSPQQTLGAKVPHPLSLDSLEIIDP
jgi:hypothetical protein